MACRYVYRLQRMIKVGTCCTIAVPIVVEEIVGLIDRRLVAQNNTRCFTIILVRRGWLSVWRWMPIGMNCWRSMFFRVLPDDMADFGRCTWMI